MTSLERTCNGLKRYYATMGIDDYNDNFKNYCDENGIDDEGLDEDIEADDATGALIVDFDESFPLALNEVDVDDEENETETKHKIYNIIKKCWTNADAYKKAPILQSDKVSDDKDITDKQTQENDQDEKHEDRKITRGLKKRDNVLVLCLTIAEYDEPYQSLDDTTTDESVYRQLFEEKYKYKFETNKNKRMNSKEVHKFFLHGRNILYDYTEFKLNYNALIVTYGGHGTDDKIVCSDGSKYDYYKMRKIFLTEDAFENVPKIYLVDACRSQDVVEQNKDKDVKPRANGDCRTYSTTLLQSHGNKVYGCKICRFITEELAHNFDKQEYRNWGIVYKAAKKKVEAESEYKQTVVLNEHDADVEDIQLLPYIASGSRGHPIERHNTDKRQVAPPDALQRILRKYYQLFKENGLDTVEALNAVDDQRLQQLGVEEADRPQLLEACHCQQVNIE